MSRLQFDRLSRAYGTSAVVDEVSLDIAEGELVVLLTGTRADERVMAGDACFQLATGYPGSRPCTVARRPERLSREPVGAQASETVTATIELATISVRCANTWSGSARTSASSSGTPRPVLRLRSPSERWSRSPGTQAPSGCSMPSVQPFRA